MRKSDPRARLCSVRLACQLSKFEPSRVPSGSGGLAVSAAQGPESFNIHGPPIGPLKAMAMAMASLMASYGYAHGQHDTQAIMHVHMSE